PEAANNAGVGGAMIPLFSLGIPGSATTALLLFVFTMYGLQPGPLTAAAPSSPNPGTTALLLFVFTMYGLQPGPLIFRDESGLIWTIIASMYIGNIALIILNLPMVGVFVKL